MCACDSPARAPSWSNARRCTGVDDVILWNAEREVTEATIANVAVRHADRANVSEFAAGDMRRRSFEATAVTLGLLLCGYPVAGPAAGAQSSGRVAALAQQAENKAALDSARTGETQTIADQIRFCEAPVPPFNESTRAQRTS